MSIPDALRDLINKPGAVYTPTKLTVMFAEDWALIKSWFSFLLGSRILPGTITMWGSTTAPSGHLICNGVSLARVGDYADLFAIIGTSFGSADGDHFNIPDFRGTFPVGKQLVYAPYAGSIGMTGGANQHTLTSDELATHSHTQNSHNHTQDAHNHTSDAHGHTQDAHNHTQNGHKHTINSYYTTNSVSTHTHNYSHASYVVAAPTEFSLTLDTACTAPNSATATNQSATATNQGTAVSITNSTSTNQSATATNQNTGSSTPFSLLNPYLTVNFIIKY